MPEIVICDTSPLLYLYRSDCFELLKKLYATITVPMAVADELNEGSYRGLRVPTIQQYDWIEIKNTRIPDRIMMIPDLGKGESEVIAFGLEYKNHLMIFDDKMAREIAKLNSLTFTGTAGILLKSKQMGYIEEIHSVLKRIQEEGFFLKEDLKQNILKLAGEGESE